MVFQVTYTGGQPGSRSASILPEVRDYASSGQLITTTAAQTFAE